MCLLARRCSRGSRSRVRPLSAQLSVSACSPCSAESRMQLSHDNCLITDNSSEAICTVRSNAATEPGPGRCGIATSAFGAKPSFGAKSPTSGLGRQCELENRVSGHPLRMRPSRIERPHRPINRPMPASQQTTHRRLLTLRTGLDSGGIDLKVNDRAGDEPGARPAGS